ncbi:hypothetical protein JSE7799_01578 [Jannaschia seosinensis]|uniref:Succinate dehydrogenase n=1 Tax=Jannaschia seosinensis TaxID=313367 RepID=A0A0M7B819_9RHOB|nr:hypothetical protein [Jannaschia seosinensis]CUH38860.1 hypothetical protein JSE7799_01578 [Jannaschia seosinensis]
MRHEILLLPLALAACDTALGTEVSRAAAKSAVNPILAARFPGLPLEPATNCVIDNATGSEIVTLAGVAATGAAPDDTTMRIVLDIVRRPATIECIAAEGLPVLLQTL